MICTDCWPVVLIDERYDQPVCDYAVYGYPYCPRCQEHHREWPDCPGVTNEEIEQDQARHAAILRTASMSTTGGVWYPLTDPIQQGDPLMPDITEPRELTPVQKFWGGGDNGFKDLVPHVEKVTPEEVAEAEEAMTPVPKASPAPEPVGSVPSIQAGAPTRSETPALPESTIPTVVKSDADSESGKLSESNEAESPTTSPQSPEPESSSSSSSSETSPGSNMPPVSVQPPPVVSPPAVQTTPNP